MLLAPGTPSGGLRAPRGRGHGKSPSGPSPRTGSGLNFKLRSPVLRSRCAAVAEPCTYPANSKRAENDTAPQTRPGQSHLNLPTSEIGFCNGLDYVREGLPLFLVEGGLQVWVRIFWLVNFGESALHLRRLNKYRILDAITLFSP